MSAFGISVIFAAIELRSAVYGLLVEFVLARLLLVPFAGPKWNPDPAKPFPSAFAVVWPVVAEFPKMLGFELLNNAFPAVEEPKPLPRAGFAPLPSDEPLPKDMPPLFPRDMLLLFPDEMPLVLFPNEKPLLLLLLLVLLVFPNEKPLLELLPFPNENPLPFPELGPVCWDFEENMLAMDVEKVVLWRKRWTK